MAIDLKAVLDLPMLKSNDAGAATVRGYLKALLTELWRQEESFSGTRPFCINSPGWQHDVYAALVRGGAIGGVIDEDGFVNGVINTRAADELILKAIGSLT